MPRISPAADLEADALEARPRPAVGFQAVDAQPHAAGRGRRLFRRRDLVPAHQFGQPPLADGVVVGHLGRHAALLHDRHAVGDGQDFVQLVADEDHPHALCGHHPQRGEQSVDLLRGQRGRGLVEDQDARAADQRLDDLQALLLADRQVADAHIRRQLQAEAPFDLLHAREGEAAVQAQAAAGLAHHQVFQDRVTRHQVEVLVHHPDPVRQRVRGALDAHRPAVDGDPPGVRGVDPEQDVHQGGLAGPVLPEQPEDVAARQRQVDAVVGLHGAEPLGDAAHLEEGGALHIGSFRRAHRRRRGCDRLRNDIPSAPF